MLLVVILATSLLQVYSNPKQNTVHGVEMYQRFCEETALIQQINPKHLNHGISSHRQKNNKQLKRMTHRLSHCKQKEDKFLKEYLYLSQNSCENTVGWLKRQCCFNIAVLIHKFDHLSHMILNELASQHDVCLAWVVTNVDTAVCYLMRVIFTCVERLDDIDRIIVTSHADVRIVRHAMDAKSTTKPVLITSVVYTLKQYDTMYRLIERLCGLRMIGIQTLILRMPLASRVVNPSKWEQSIKNKGINWQFVKKHPDICIQLVGREVKDMIRLYVNGSFYDDDGMKYKDYFVRMDRQSKYVNVVNHIRPATDIPATVFHIVHIFGDSTVKGNSDADKDTIASFLQRMINERHKLTQYACLIYAANGVTPDMMQRRLRDTSVKVGDIVSVIFVNTHIIIPEFTRSCVENGVLFYDSQRDFNRPHDFGEVFVDADHVFGEGNKIVAGILYTNLFVITAKMTGTAFFQHQFCDSSKLNHPFVGKHQLKMVSGIHEMSDNSKFLLFIRGLKLYHGSHQMVGAAVLNCNPFTLGHLYLLESAATQVDKLFVFVVEEDWSEFKFTERIELVRMGVIHMLNVVVLASSEFAISAVTLPEYFVKDQNQKIRLDPSTDLEIFCRWISPALNVRVRFVGEEPLDRVTRQYNVAMENTLPMYGLKLHVLSRVYFEGSVISASRVRFLWKDLNFYEIAYIVPEATLMHMMKRSGI